MVQQITKLAAVFLPLLLLAAPASACLTTNQILTLITVQAKLNLTNNELLDMFNTVCNESYTKAELDSRFDNYDEVFDTKIDLVDEKISNIDMSGIDQHVDEKLQNYTEYWEARAGIDAMLIAIYNQTKSDPINGSQFMQANERQAIYNRLDGLDADVVSLRNANTYTGSTTGSQQDGSWMPWLALIVGLVVVFAFQGNIRKMLKGQRQPMQPYPPQFPQVPQFQQPNRAGILDEDLEVRKARESRTKSMLYKAKKMALEEDADKARGIQDKKKRQEEFDRIERELEELSRKEHGE